MIMSQVITFENVPKRKNYAYTSLHDIIVVLCKIGGIDEKGNFKNERKKKV